MAAKGTRRRDLRRVFNSEILKFKHVQVSLCNRTSAEAKEELMERARNTSSDLSRARIEALASLLDELIVNPCLPFERAYEEYAAMLDSVAQSKDQKSARVQFRESLLSRNGLPVIILENRGNRYINA
jgi:hypothetical protein